MLVRATTTTNAHGRHKQQRLHIPTIRVSNEIDNDYLQALKVF